MKVKPVLEVTRGNTVESVHHGAIVTADVHGHVHAHWGDPELVTYLRSSAKPFQALPFLESGAAENFEVSDREIAVVCASHSGSDEHVRMVQSLQRKMGLEETHLQCGFHPPFDQAVAKRMGAQGEQPTPIRHNCSGKHTAMLGLAAYWGHSLEDYLQPEHPVQQAILHAFAEMCNLDVQAVNLGTDGCSAPNFAIPLQAAATAFARLADPSGLSETSASACRRIFRSMTGAPDMVGGTGRFDTELMTVTGKRVLSKSGAEGYYALGIAPGGIHEGSPALGIAIKIADGNLGHRAGPPVAIHLLKNLGVLGVEDYERLARFAVRPLKNFRDIEIGELRVPSPLESWPTA